MCEMYFRSMRLLKAPYLSVLSLEESACIKLEVKDSNRFGSIAELLKQTFHPEGKKEI